MNTKIIILHSSEIIAKGILAMIKQLCTIDTYIHSLSQKNIEKTIHNQHILCFAEENFPIALNIILEWKKTNKVTLIPISTVYNETSNNEKINLFTTTEQLNQVLATFIQSTKDFKQAPTNNELTQREKEVLQLVALGNTNKTIAEKLFISTHTVMTHRKNITEKLGIKSMPGLTVYALINKIIDIEELETNNMYHE